MTVRTVEVERLSVTSSKPFEVVVAALEAAIGHPDMVEFVKAIEGARTFAELESEVNRSVGRTGLMMFMKFDHGAILRKETGLDTPKIVRFLIGNPLIMKEMAKHVSTLDLTLRSQLWWMSGPTACICRMTRWPVFWPPTETPTLSLSLRIWIRKSRTFFESLQFDYIAVRLPSRCHQTRRIRLIHGQPDVSGWMMRYVAFEYVTFDTQT